MGKVALRVASAATSMAIAGCALLAAGNSAAAATEPVNGHGPRMIAAQNAEGSDFDRRTSHCADEYTYRSDGRDSNDAPWTQGTIDSRYYPWVYDQLVQFCDEISHR
ncbi:hypothetical protein [Streptomyces griseoluteus]|uniref:hypothetical protein n=1 Tax=Streptomyces griseoluteus TaxID=29306 RepID=UPI0037005948